MKCVSAEKSRSCSLSTLMRTTLLMCSRPLRLVQNDSTSPGHQKRRQDGGGVSERLLNICRRGQTFICEAVNVTTLVFVSLEIQLTERHCSV